MQFKKNNKVCSSDLIIDEFLKASSSKILSVFTTLFNLVLESGLIPKSWTCRFIKPIYKNKYFVADAKKYRGITTLS